MKRRQEKQEKQGNLCKRQKNIERTNSGQIEKQTEKHYNIIEYIERVVGICGNNMKEKKYYFVFSMVFGAYFLFLTAGYYMTNIINKVFGFDEIIQSSVALLCCMIPGVVVSFVLWNLAAAILSLTKFQNNKVSFISLCYNGKFYFDHSLENIFIGKNGPKIYAQKDTTLTLNDIYKFKNIQYAILVVVIVIASLFYYSFNGNILLIFLMALTVFAVIISVVYLKYNESDAYNKALTLCIYQKVFNDHIVNTLKEKVFSESDTQMETELYLKRKILMVNNNIDDADSDSVLNKIGEKNIFILLYSEVLNNIFYMKNGRGVGYKYSGYYSETPVAEKIFSEAGKMTYARDVHGLANVLPYRIKKMLQI